MEVKTSVYKQLFIAFIFNGIILLFIAFKYFNYIESITYTFAKTYYLFSFISHFFSIALIPLLIGSLSYRLLKNRELSHLLFYTLSTLIVLIIKLDTVIFTQFRFHISPVILKMVFGKNATDIFHFSVINIIKALALISLLIFTQYIIHRTSKKVCEYLNKKHLISFYTALFLMLGFSHVSFAWSDASSYKPITQSIEIFPFYFPLTCEDLLTEYNIVDTSLKKKNEQLYKLNNNSIIYPLSKIKTVPKTHKKNMLVLMIDSWRYDCMDSIITPNIHRLSKKSQVFNNHHSGSNATADGVFTFFYGISGLCNTQFTDHGIAPVLIDELKQQEYAFDILGSATLENPPFNKNVFLNIPDLRLNSKSDSPSKRDSEITNEWLNNHHKKLTQPFFDFLFFDAAHGFDYPKDYPIKFKPSLQSIDYTSIDDDYEPTAFYNAYKNSLHFIDAEIGKIITKLEGEQLLDDTLIIITGDHGQEFNDNKKGYWQHGGNYTPYQTQTPLIVFDSSKKPKTHHHTTLHYDIAPTIMTNYLGITNNVDDYSIGKNLFDATKRDWFLCGFKNTYAVIEKNKITKIYRNSGVYSVTDKQLNKIDNQTIDYTIFQKALDDINRFYTKD
ncbi:MAG: sulfatase-like hydrolase/transferase [Flavobacteriaceae bacterium]